MNEQQSLHESLETAWWYRLREFDQNPPKCLFHYTDIDAFCSIILNKELWATEVLFLNDSSELFYGLNIAKGISVELLKEDLNETQRSFLLPIVNGGNIFENADVYVASLTACEDTLSQWRGYGDKNRSVSIGFNIAESKIYGESNPYCSYELVKVHYDFSDQSKLIFEFLSGYIYGIKDLPPEEVIQRNRVKYVGLLMLIARMKHPSWKEEEEWRLITGTYEYVGTELHRIKRNFRGGKNSLIPYVKAKFMNEKSISKIYFPNNEYFRKNHYSAKEILIEGNYDLTNIAIEPSNIPIVY